MKPRKPSKEQITAIADRAEARSKGQEPQDNKHTELNPQSVETKKKKMGRPTLYTPELGAKICKLITQLMPLSQIVLLDGMPCEDTVFEWLKVHRDFSELYARAREARADQRVEKMNEIAQQALLGQIDAHSARVAIDMHKWVAAKEQPRKYGDRQFVESSVEIKDYRQLSDDELKSEIAQQMEELTSLIGSNPGSQAVN